MRPGERFACVLSNIFGMDGDCPPPSPSRTERGLSAAPAPPSSGANSRPTTTGWPFLFDPMERRAVRRRDDAVAVAEAVVDLVQLQQHEVLVGEGDPVVRVPQRPDAQRLEEREYLGHIRANCDRSFGTL